MTHSVSTTALSTANGMRKAQTNSGISAMFTATAATLAV